MAMKQSDLEKLSHAEFWDGRYAAEKGDAKAQGTNEEEDGTEGELGNFEWFRTFQDLKQFFGKRLPAPETEPEILHLGCGNSSLPLDLHTLGYTKQTSVDFSSVVIDAMSAKYSHINQTWLVMDIRDLKFPSNSIDVAIDKGTLDALIYGSLWDPPQEVIDNIGKYVDEVARVLKKGGEWLYITFRQPHFVRRHLEREGIWTAEYEVIGDGQATFEYFGWTMKKL